MINFDKITDIFCTVDEFCIEFEKFTQPFSIGNPPKKKPKMSNAETITIMILFQLSGFRTFKHFYIYYVQKHMKQEFPQTVSYNRFYGTYAIQSDDSYHVCKNLRTGKVYRHFLCGQHIDQSMRQQKD